MSALLERFIRTFQKAISAEMEAMRQQLGPFEVPLGKGRALDKEEGEQGRFYTFEVLQANDKLVLQAECTLRYEGGELLVTVIDLNQAQITLRASLGQALRQQEVNVVQQARVILATMTNVYLSNLLQPERYDAVIVEEAGMAILPTMFYCATLAKTKLVMVGDPQQLPPIVQSRDDYVYRAMGRNIFEVAASNGLDPEDRVMLDVQYRMHPVIGDLVSRLFYDGKLRHGENTRQRSEISGKPPYPGQPLVVIDTNGQTICMTQADSFSRLNERTAQLCVDLALEAVQGGAGTVAIITPYVAQSRLIRRHLARFSQEAEQIECRTVHRFQGGERDVVILDTVDTAPLPPGVLLTGTSPGASSSNLLNVSISRAREKLILIADVSYFRRTSPRSMINSVLGQAIKAGICLSIQESSQIMKNIFPFTNGQ